MAHGDDFWDLGTPKAKVYEKPTFGEERLSVTEISDGGASDPSAAREKIPPKPEGGRVRNTVDGPRYVTSSYRRHTVHPAPRPDPVRQSATLVSSYSPGGLLLSKVEVRTWETDAEFYGRFATDALLSHRSQPSVPYTQPMEAVPYFSYVPQYAHMNLRQTEYYRWIRENIRHGQFPACDLPYLQLYIFELINLAAETDPAEGLASLTALWLGYRTLYPRLDGCLSEWLADYCLIHALPMPEALTPILDEIVPKAQFKEFYLNAPLPEDVLGRVLIESSSDYDYKTSRYYPDHRAAYDEKIPAAVSAALASAYAEKRGIFALDRVYRITRDSYCGAVVSSGVKRRLDIEFCSFTRRADTRAALTALVKYTENKLRAVLGVKAKINADGVAQEDAAFLDAYFQPMLPEKLRRPAEDRYMPDGYMAAYEADATGFDLTAAADIEESSWTNTARLTGDEFTLPDESDGSEGLTEEIDGAVTDRADEITAAEITAAEITAEAIPETAPEAEAVPQQLLAAVSAALGGSFRSFVRANGLFEGDAANEINTVFLDFLGDVILEDGGNGYELIEDYREDVDLWLRQHQAP